MCCVWFAVKITQNKLYLCVCLFKIAVWLLKSSVIEIRTEILWLSRHSCCSWTTNEQWPMAATSSTSFCLSILYIATENPWHFAYPVAAISKVVIFGTSVCCPADVVVCLLFSILGVISANILLDLSSWFSCTYCLLGCMSLLCVYFERTGLVPWYYFVLG